MTACWICLLLNSPPAPEAAIITATGVSNAVPAHTTVWHLCRWYRLGPDLRADLALDLHRGDGGWP